MNKKMMTLSLLGLVCTTLLIGCGKTEQTKEKTVKEDQAVTLTVHGGTADAGAFDGEWPIFKEASAKMNLSLKGDIPQTVTDFDQAFSLMMASGDLSDIVLTGANEFFKYGPEGAFEPLDDLIEAHAPSIKQFLADNPDVKSKATGPDGKLWFIPFVQDGEAQSGWFIRQDWLAKLNLETPKTVADLHKVMTAFANDDPNGNGKKDEVPYFHRDPLLGIDELLSLWGATPSYRVVDGKVAYGPMEDQYREGYTNIAKWYQEGLIDEEIYTRANARDVLLADNLGGVTHDWFGSTANYNDKLPEKIAEFAFEPIAPPKNSEGNALEPTKRKHAIPYGWGISSNNEEIEKTMAFFDYWFTEEGRRAANFGIEGDTYTMVDGKPIFTDKVLKSDKPAVAIIRETGAQSNFGFKQDYSYEEQWLNPIARKGIVDYTENNYFAEQYPDVKYTEEEQKEIEKIVPKVTTFITETTQQWVLGSKEVNHDQFKIELEKLGVKTLMEINQKAYDRYIKEVGN